MGRRRRKLTVATFLLSAACVPAGAFAQASLERFERQLEQIRRDTRIRPDPNVPVGQRTLVDYGAYTTVNYLSLDDPALNNRGLWQYDLTAYGRVNVDGIHDFFLRGRAFYRDFNEGDEFENESDGADARVERAFYRIDLARYFSASRGQPLGNELAIKVGRDTVLWGNGLSLSQELDGIVADFSLGRASVQVIGGVTPRDTVDFDSSRPDFNEDTKRGFYGALLSTRIAKHRPYVYGLIQRDYNDDSVTAEIGGVDVTTEYEYNSFYLGLGANGAITDRLAYGVELVFEGGDTKSGSFGVDANGNVVPNAQTSDDIQAWAFDGQLDYLFTDRRDTRLSGELILASGDSDRIRTSTTLGGNRPGTNDDAFNSFGLLNTGLAFAPTVSNLIALRGGLSTFPFPDCPPLRRMQVGTDSFVFAKFNENAPIDEDTTDDRFLGFEQDIYVNWEIHSDVALALRYGAFIPGDAIENDGKIRQFFYAGVTFAF